MQTKLILDACCGGRQFWFNKQHPDTVYIDIRREHKGCLDCRPNFEVEPDIEMDFRKLDFPDGQFKLIVWDPPHLHSLAPTSIMGKKYGALNRETWKQDLRDGFNEVWRVLAQYGTLVFKWNTTEIPLKEVLACFKEQPLFGHPTAKHGKTIWCVFFKNSTEVKCPHSSHS
jgi:SAM-dependent methyltransferase